MVGRFAPTPSGDLHLGSLVAATASYLFAKQHAGRWLLRIDDLDPPRVKAGSIDSILTTLTAFGFEWDALYYQSARYEHYQFAIDQLKQQDQAYPCNCSRSQLKARGAFHVYDRYCLTHPLSNPAETAHGWRINSESISHFSWQDLIQGTQTTDWQAEHGDFLIQRTDGIMAYHLACAIDDASMGITHVIRGEDLLSSTAPQLLIQQALALPSPQYGHHSLIYDQHNGIKLSKASGARPLDKQAAPTQLCQVLNFLGYPINPTLTTAPLNEIWQWAMQQPPLFA